MPPTNTRSNTKITNFFSRTPASQSSSQDTSSTPNERRSNTAAAHLPPAMNNTPSFEQPGIPALQLRRESSTASQAAQDACRNRVIPSSDGEDSDDSDDDVFHLGSFLRAASKPKVTPRPKAPALSFKKSEFGPMPETTIRKRPPTNSISRILEDVKKQRAQDALLKQTREKYENNSKPGKSTAAAASVTAEDASVFVGAESADRFASAMDKTEAFKVEEIWECFDTELPGNEDAMEFPTDDISKSETFSCMSDSFLREDMFLSGFVADMAACGINPPYKLVEWMLQQICIETRQDLSWAYFSALMNILTPDLAETKAFLTESTIKALWRSLGAKEDAVDTSIPVKLTARTYEVKRNDNSWNIRLLVALLGQVVDTSDGSLTATVCEMLLRVGLDDHISHDSEVVMQVTQSVEELLSRIPDNLWEAQAQLHGTILFRNMSQAQTRENLLQLLPNSTPRLHLFRRRLALAFVFEDVSYVSKPIEDLVDLQQFTALLETSPAFKITHDSDFANLTVLVRILDVAVDAGGTGAHASNDAEVDNLARALQRLFTGIPDNNAQNISRTEAKEGMERIQFRLIFAVRSKARQALDGRDGLKQGKLSFRTDTT